MLDFLKFGKAKADRLPAVIDAAPLQKVEPVIVKKLSDSSVNPFYYANSGLTNNLTGLGMQNDRGTGNVWNINQIYNNRPLLETIYNQSWAAKKFIDIPVDDMLIMPRKLINLDQKKADDFDKLSKTLDVNNKIGDAIKAARLMGTAFIAIITKEAPPDEPLDIDAIRKGDLCALHVVDRFYTSLLNRETDIRNPNFQFANNYFVTFKNGGSINLHHTRLIRIDGIKALSVNGFQAYHQDWGLSILLHALSAINTEEAAAAGANQLLQESSVPVLKIPNLRDALSGAPDAEVDINNLTTKISILKSIYKMIYLDSTHDLTRLNATFSGIPELIDRLGARLAAATDIPATRFYGQPPVGFNATGDSDLTNYAIMVGALQVKKLTPIYEKLDAIMAKSLGINDPIQYKFDKLINLTEAQQAAAVLAKAQAANIWLNAGVITEQEERQRIYNEDVYPDIDPDDMDELNGTKEAMNQQIAALAKNQQTTPPQNVAPGNEEVTKGAENA